MPFAKQYNSNPTGNGYSKNDSQWYSEQYEYRILHYQFFHFILCIFPTSWKLRRKHDTKWRIQLFHRLRNIIEPLSLRFWLTGIAEMNIAGEKGLNALLTIVIHTWYCGNVIMNRFSLERLCVIESTYLSPMFFASGLNKNNSYFRITNAIDTQPRSSWPFYNNVEF